MDSVDLEIIEERFLELKKEAIENSEIMKLLYLKKDDIKLLNKNSKNNIDARNLLATLYLYGGENLEQNISKSIELFINSSKVGNEYATEQLKHIFNNYPENKTLEKYFKD